MQLFRGGIVKSVFGIKFVQSILYKQGLQNPLSDHQHYDQCIFPGKML